MSFGVAVSERTWLQGGNKHDLDKGPDLEEIEAQTKSKHVCLSGITLNKDVCPNKALRAELETYGKEKPSSRNWAQKRHGQF